MFRTNQDYFSFIKELRHKFPGLIKEYETLIIEKTLKVTYCPATFSTLASRTSSA